MCKNFTIFETFGELAARRIHTFGEREKKETGFENKEKFRKLKASLES